MVMRKSVLLMPRRERMAQTAPSRSKKKKLSWRSFSACCLMR